MVMTRNGIAASGQLAVADLAAFTIPDTTAAPTASNFTNVFARFNAVAVGTGTTAAAATHTGLEAELTTAGLGRRSGQNSNPATTVRNGVYTWLSSRAGTGDRIIHISNWSAAWLVTGSVSIAEVGVFNSATANTGLCLTRQVFTTPWPVVNNDVFRITVSVEHDGSFVAGGTGVKGGMVSNVGLRELARLLMHPTTDRIGADSDPPLTVNAGDWESDGGYGASTKFDTVALGSSLLARDLDQTALLTEISANGSARVTGANVVGSLMRDPELYPSDLFNNFAGDTVQWRHNTYWTATGAGFSVGEYGVFNSNATIDVMLISAVAAALLPLDKAGDRFNVVVRLLSQ